MTVVTIELMVRRKTLCLSVVHRKRAGYFGCRKRQTLVVGAVTVRARLVSVTVNVVRMRIDPSLADDVTAMRTAVGGCRQSTGVASGALCDLGCVSLKLDRIDIVVAFEGWIFGVRRSVAPGTEHATVPCAEAVQVRPWNRNVGIRGKGLIRCLPPFAGGVESGCVALARVVAHLAGRLDEPWIASALAANIAHITVATGAGLRVHRTALALRYRPWVAEITGIQVILRFV